MTVVMMGVGETWVTEERVGVTTREEEQEGKKGQTLFSAVVGPEWQCLSADVLMPLAPGLLTHQPVYSRVGFCCFSLQTK